MIIKLILLDELSRDNLESDHILDTIEIKIDLIEQKIDSMSEQQQEFKKEFIASKKIKKYQLITFK